MTVSSNQKQIVIIGAAGNALQMADSISRNRENRLLGFLDDNPEKQTQGYHGLPVLGGLSYWRNLSPEYLFLSSLYGPRKTLNFFKLIKSLGIPESRWATLIDPYAIVSETAELGYGTYIGPHTTVHQMVRLGNHCALFGNVYISHHSHLADYVVCANSVCILGAVSVGEASFIGAGATIRDYTRIGAHAIVGMGSVVLKDVPDGEIVLGNPARPLRRMQTRTGKSSTI